jgi:hypothetical protein
MLLFMKIDLQNNFQRCKFFQSARGSDQRIRKWGLRFDGIGVSIADLRSF